jgi:hypothetical protein
MESGRELVAISNLPSLLGPKVDVSSVASTISLKTAVAASIECKGDFSTIIAFGKF